MRILFTCFIVFQSITAMAQASQDPSPRILTVDTTVNMAEVFNNEIMQYAPGYRLIGADNSTKGKVLYSYTNGGDGIVRMEYKYITQNGKPIVIYQSITADLEIIMPIVNGLFSTNMASDIQHAGMISGPVTYNGKEYQCLMQVDEYRAGYWVLAFVKS
jgi:hypothetical protein